MKLFLGIFGAPLIIVGALSIAGPANAGQPAKPCSAPEYRQFDFWLGDWDVFSADGKLIGHNTITLEQGGCVLHEHWTGAGSGGGTGESFNMYDVSRKLWHQTWVAASGNLLLLDGGLVDGAMVLSGDKPAKGGGTQTNRIAWTLAKDGSVEQRWDVSLDGGKTWKQGFLGIYRKSAE